MLGFQRRCSICNCSPRDPEQLDKEISRGASVYCSGFYVDVQVVPLVVAMGQLVWGTGGSVSPLAWSRTASGKHRITTILRGTSSTHAGKTCALVGAVRAPLEVSAIPISGPLD